MKAKSKKEIEEELLKSLEYERVRKTIKTSQMSL